ncbi:MAG: AtpZ/AtpI family protein [Microscillaceae bacterium]|jgi:F0F1-type ATP synthase assembly protein I|nr:AtpZ/AtpI family protein [Microscillaceae bacterium]
MSKLPNQPPQEPINQYLKYSTLGFQMLAMILLGVWGGWSLDKSSGYKIPIFTLIFSLLAVIGSLVYFIRKISQEK